MIPVTNQTSQQSQAGKPQDLSFLNVILGINAASEDLLAESLPFSRHDATAGAENEFQAAVIGKRRNLDLAITIEESNYFKNMVQIASSGDTSRKKLIGLEKYLEEKTNSVWENSWVRFPRRMLNPYANNIFRSDLKSDKTDPGSADRTDTDHFIFHKNAEEFIRVPVSYLLKLSIADAIGGDENLHPFIRGCGEKMMAHFSNDNTSPEVYSFYPVRSISSDTIGKELARETLIRFLFTQLLVGYAENQFGLKTHGQEVRVFFSASPPIMQKQLNECISDAFYRYLFMSPCLSGWNRGQEKFEYMNLCHEVLSRSQINGIAKLKEAGIITSNLVVLPNSSNISLANNGTHISLGSRKLERLIKDPSAGFNAGHEKSIGDLVIKISEHFLCLFPGTYSASPYRLDFKDFHPEKLLGFLPHELEITHLRKIWRRWKKKAGISILGQPITPFGPAWLDTFISTIFRLKGDYVPDFRLIDYFISLLSTNQSPSLNGVLQNGDQLKKDLSHMGVFNEKMPLYQLIRLREYAQMTYTGFEHRHFSIFENIMEDMSSAADLQNLITALACQYIFSGNITHDMIPDTPEIESERRQIFFCSAINLPTFFIKTRTKNQFMHRILKQTAHTRHSRRYPGYTRIHMADYKTALIQTLKTDGAVLISNLNLHGLLPDLELRTRSPSRSAAGKLVSGILAPQKKNSPMTLDSEQFNRKAENYYSETLRGKQIKQGFNVLEAEFRQFDLWAEFRETAYNDLIQQILGQTDLFDFLADSQRRFLENTLPHQQIKQLILLIILYVHKKNKSFNRN